MKRFILLITILIISVLLGLNINLHDTSAKQKDPLDLINKISYMHAPDCGNHNNPYNSTLFTVTFKWGKGCNSSICDEINGTFHCVDPGDKCTTTSHVHSGSLTVTNGSCPSSVSSKKWDCYDVYIPVDGNYQDARGKIKRLKEFDLTVVSIDESWNRLDSVTGLAPQTTTVFYGKTASIRRGNTNTGYTFIGWADGYSGGDVYSKVMKEDYVAYAVYRGESGSSGTGITVKNNTVAKYSGNGLTAVYAKPGTITDPTGDKITYTASYSAGAQSGTRWYPQVVEIGKNGGWNGACGGNNTVLTLNALFNQCRGGNNSWNNTYSVTKDNFSYDTNPIHYPSFAAGNTSTRTNSNDHIVKPSEVGKALTEHSRTNADWSTQSTPKSYAIGLANGLSSGKVDITALDATASAYVPYNFENISNKPRKPDDPNDDNNNDDDVNDESNDKIVYAGEQDRFEFSIDVTPRYNSETNGTYATIVNKAKWRLGLCIGNNCNKPDTDSSKYSYSQEWGGTASDILNRNGNLNGEYGIKKANLNINIPDLTAGSRICVVAEVFPKTSGSPLNWDNTNYDGTWARSPKSCYTIAKRPSVQFWGGNVYSRGNLNTSTALKNNLAGYSQYAYNAKQSKGTFVFGSWGELGVVGNGTISGFGSGASMGYAKNSDGTVWQKYQFTGADGTAKSYRGAGNNAAILGEPGGGRTSSFCNRILLTIPNSPCSSTVGGMSSAIAITNATSDKNYIVELLASGKSTTNHSHSSSDRDVSKADIGEEIDGGTTKVISSDGNITITSDLDYLSGEYKNYGQMPKLVIYSKQNIYINCEVGRIDALLIANDTVVTCKNFDDTLTSDHVADHINDEANSNQLIVNGAIIAKRLIPNRTYGAATGANSIIPAEIVNFDPTLYQFGSSAETDDDTTGRLDITYIHEIAPRI